MSAPAPASGRVRVAAPGPLRADRLAPSGKTAQHLATGACALAVALLPWVRPSLAGNAGPVDGLIGLAIVVTLVWVGQDRVPIRIPYGWTMSLFIAAGATGALVQGIPGGSGFALVQDVVLLLWCAALTTVARDPRALRVLLVVWGWTAIACAVWLDVAVATGNLHLAGTEASTGGRARLLFADPNMAANYFVVAILVLAAARVPRNRALRLVAYGAMLTALVLTGSNGGFVSLAVGIATASVITTYRRAGPLPAVALLSALVVVGVLAVQQVHLTELEQSARVSKYRVLRDSVGRGAESEGSRAQLLRESARLFEEGSVLGRGPASTKPILDADQAPYVKEAHDDYLAALVERGVAGMAALLLLIAGVGMRTWTAVSRPLPAGFAAALPRPAPLFGAVAACGVAATFYEVLHFRHVWVLLAVVAALHLAVTLPSGVRDAAPDR